MSDVLETRREDRLLILTLNRPQKRNALNLELANALLHALDAAEADPATAAILLLASGQTFCAGMDLNEIGTVDSDELDRIHEALFSTAVRLTKPLVAAVTGAALAGGTGLVANAHIVVAAPDATFGLTEIRIGLWPFLVFRAVSLAIGERRCTEMSLTGRILPAEEAHRLGLVHEISTAPAERAWEIALQLSQQSSFAMKMGLNSTNEARGRTWTETGEIARRARTQVLSHPDFAEGLAAFREKRNPNLDFRKPARA